MLSRADTVEFIGLVWFNMVQFGMHLHVVPTQIELSRPGLDLCGKHSISKYYTCTTVNPILLVNMFLHTESNCKYNLLLSQLKKRLLAPFVWFFRHVLKKANFAFELTMASSMESSPPGL